AGTYRGSSGPLRAVPPRVVAHSSRLGGPRRGVRAQAGGNARSPERLAARLCGPGARRRGWMPGRGAGPDVRAARGGRTSPRRASPARCAARPFNDGEAPGNLAERLRMELLRTVTRRARIDTSAAA